MNYPLAIVFLLCAMALPASAQTITACDWETSHPSDPDRVGPGVSSSKVNTERAKAACEKAVAEQPDEPRFHYQLGRAMVYAADRQEQDWHPGAVHVRRAAEMRHVQAMFVHSLLLQRDKLWCDAEPWLRNAADAGLKAARIGYVNEYLEGRLDECDETAPISTMQQYLADAEGQMSGWYQQMLLTALQRNLASVAP